MLVGERMSRPPITIGPEMSINDALALFKKERIRRAPVIKGGKLVGIVSEKDLLNASPSPATTLSIWEMNYLLSTLKIDKLMTRNPKTIHADATIGEVARLMLENRVSGLPVVDDDHHVIGIITESDIFSMIVLHEWSAEGA